jgi:hypothetical protein
MKKLRICAIACFFLFLLNSAQADMLTVKSVDGDWSNPIGGSFINYNDGVVVAYGNLSQDQIRWGEDISQGQSGLGFTGIANNTDITVGSPFEIGQLVHFNRPIETGTASSAVDLTIDLEFDTVESFTFQLGINETPNQPPYGGYGTSDDFIYFPSSYTSQTFYIGGLPYTLQLIGFGPDAGSLLDYFQSPEGTDNATLLWGEINLVPVPGAVLLGILGLSAAGLKLRRFA